MNVAELIDLLQTIDPTLPVKFRSSESDARGTDFTIEDGKLLIEA